MTIAAATVYQSATTFICDVTCADADVGPTNIAHGIVNNGIANTPKSLTITALANVANYAGWSISANATNIVLSKNNVVGSGGTTPGTTNVIRVRASLPHSIT